MSKAISLYLTNWPIDLALRRERLRGSAPRAEPFLLVHTVQQRPVVAACCARAQGAGVRRGMRVADARALIKCGAVRIEALRPQQDAACLESLARWAMRFTPTVAVDGAEGLLLDITGCHRLFGGVGRLTERLARGLDRRGIGWRIAAAPTFGAAWGLARFGPERLCIIESNGWTEALATLPVAALRIAPETVQALAEVGLERVGQLITLPRSTLPSRFGPDLLARLDQALGRMYERIEPVRAWQPPTAQRALDGPTRDLEVLSVVVRELLGALAQQLESRGQGARRLEAVFDRSDVGPLTVAVMLGRPSREVKHLWSLLWPRMERMQMGFGIECVTVRATRVGIVRGRQSSRWMSDPDQGRWSAEFDELCDALVNRLGPAGVQQAHLVDTHIPERAWAMTTVRQGGAIMGPASLDSDRPLVMLHPPEPVASIAGAGDAPPWRLTWRGQDFTVIASIGPERIAEAWWAGSGGPAPGQAAARDYFKVQEQSGRWLWVYRRTGTAHWFIHGLWA